jgi:choline-sulfatase
MHSISFLRLTAGLWFASANFCGPASWAAAAGDAGQPTPVILISIDTLRADHLSAYGYRRISTPNIDSFAQQGTLFTEANCQVPLTLPSHASLLTSIYPFANRIEENAESVPAGTVTLASVMRSHGFKTAAFVGSIFLERRLGLDRGFDVYDSPFNFQAGSQLSGSTLLSVPPQNPYSVRARRDGTLVVAAAIRWLDANRGQPVFIFVHLFDLHTPYSLSPAVARQRGISRYDAQLEYIDQVLGRFQKALAKRGWWDRSLVVLLSDHGESLGEHGESSHGYFMYQSTLWVPLIFHWPSGTQGYSARAEQPAGLIDVAPTVLDFLHLPTPPSFEGESLLPMLQSGSEGDSRPVYSESVYSRDAFGWAPLRGVRAGSYKYIDAPRPELYNLQQDPHEQRNLFRRDSPDALTLQGRLTKLLARYSPPRSASPHDMSPETRALLGSLGYLSVGPGANLAGFGPDPKDRLPEYLLYEKALTAVADRRMAEAIAILHEILLRDPHNTLARRDLGECYTEQRVYSKARSCFRQVLAAEPNDYTAHLDLGIVDERLGLLEEALEQVRAACRIYPDSAECHRELDGLQQKIKTPAKPIALLFRHHEYFPAVTLQRREQA